LATSDDVDGWHRVHLSILATKSAYSFLLPRVALLAVILAAKGTRLSFPACACLYRDMEFSPYFRAFFGVSAAAASDMRVNKRDQQHHKASRIGPVERPATAVQSGRHFLDGRRFLPQPLHFSQQEVAMKFKYRPVW
jgi:hypothetical protein